MTSGSDSAEKFELWISGETKSYWRNEYLVCSCELKLVICLDFWISKHILGLILDFEMYTWIDFGFQNVYLNWFWILKCSPRWILDFEMCTWIVEFGLRLRLEFGIWSLEFGIWWLEIWNSKFHFGPIFWTWLPECYLGFV
jgi:hypothetical protein